MKVFILTLVVAVAIVAAKVTDEVKAFRKLVKKLNNGVYATCDLVLFDDLVDFNEADKRCKELALFGSTQEGNLATVNDDDKNRALRDLLEMAYPSSLLEGESKWSQRNWVWAGLRKVRNNVGKTATLGDYDENDWEWENGDSPQGYEKWMKKQPDQKRNKMNGKWEYQNQMRINHAGKWDDTYAYKSHPYACDYQGKYILSATPRHWSDAKQACEDAGLAIAKVRSQNEHDEIVQAAAYFLGDAVEKVFDHSNWFWIGANDNNEEGVWKWADGEAVVDDWGIPWRKPQPDNAEYKNPNGQDYVSISKGGQWDDSFGEERKRPFACMCPAHL